MYNILIKAQVRYVFDITCNKTSRRVCKNVIFGVNAQCALFVPTAQHYGEGESVHCGINCSKVSNRLISTCYLLLSIAKSLLYCHPAISSCWPPENPISKEMFTGLNSRLSEDWQTFRTES